MDPLTPLFIIISILIGYLLGAFLPGYFLPIWFMKTDIREIGDGNPGVTNVFKNFGLTLAVPTCIYDLFKSLLPLFFIPSILKLPLPYAYAAGFAAILGHKYPFYLNFKGGRGIASTIGLFGYIFGTILINDLTSPKILSLFIFITIFSLLILLATHGTGDLLTITLFPLMGVYMLMQLPFSPKLILFLATVIMMIIEASRNLARDNIQISNHLTSPWITLSRLFPLIFIPIGLSTTHNNLLFLIGSILGIFACLDLIRIFFSKSNKILQGDIQTKAGVIQEKESSRISNLTEFLGVIFICFILLERNIAFACLGYFSFAGFLAEVVQINFGKKKLLFGRVTMVEGSLAFLSGAIAISFLLWTGGLLPLYVVSFGVIAATFSAIIFCDGWFKSAIPIIAGAFMSLL